MKMWLESLADASEFFFFCVGEWFIFHDLFVMREDCAKQVRSSASLTAGK
jgi:hypothetical protein